QLVVGLGDPVDGVLHLPQKWVVGLVDVLGQHHVFQVVGLIHTRSEAVGDNHRDHHTKHQPRRPHRDRCLSHGPQGNHHGSAPPATVPSPSAHRGTPTAAPTPGSIPIARVVGVTSCRQTRATV